MEQNETIAAVQSNPQIYTFPSGHIHEQWAKKRISTQQKDKEKGVSVWDMVKC